MNGSIGSCFSQSFNLFSRSGPSMLSRCLLKYPGLVSLSLSILPLKGPWSELDKPRVDGNCFKCGNSSKKFFNLVCTRPSRTFFFFFLFPPDSGVCSIVLQKPAPGLASGWSCPLLVHVVLEQRIEMYITVALSSFCCDRLT